MIQKINHFLIWYRNFSLLNSFKLYKDIHDQFYFLPSYYPFLFTILPISFLFIPFH